MNAESRYVPMKKAGACRSGGDRRGTLVHAVPGGRYGEQMQALCGASPSLFWSDNGIGADAEITCPTCLRRIAS